MKKLISLMLVLFMVCACDDNKLDIESEFDKNGWNEQELRRSLSIRQILSSL